MRGLKYAFLFFLISAAVVFGSSRRDLEQRISIAEDNLRYFMDAPDSAIPSHLLHEANAIIFLRQYKAGFFLGARGGTGIVLAKDRQTGEWSPPAFVATAEGSFGLQIGGKRVDAILLVMNKEGLDFLLKSRFKIGGEISAAAGPVGREAGGKIGVPAAGVLIYSRAQGLFAGVSFEGGLIVSDDEANRTFYGDEELRIRDILTRGKVGMPEEALGLINALRDYEMHHEAGNEE